MIIDKSVLIADGLGFGTASAAIDLGRVSPGKGEPITIFIQGHSDLVGVLTVTITTGTTTSPTDNLCVVSRISASDHVTFTLPSHAKQYIKLTPTVASAGNWSAGVIMQPGQTNI